MNRRSGRWRRRAVLGLALGLLAAQATVGATDDEVGGQPLLEFGAGVGAVAYPHYRGSREYNVLAFPVPLVIYRGDVFKVSRDGARVEIVDHPRLNVSFSGGGSPPVDSDDDPRRRGMPDLDPTVEFGPRVTWLFSDPDRLASHSLRLQLPVYAVAAVDIDDTAIETAGVLVQPRLQWRQSWSLPGRERSWSYSLSGGPTWASGEYHDHFYSVAPRFATPSRPAYDASGGYGGLAISGGVYHRRGRLRVGAVASMDYLEGAAFEDSPLVATTESFAAGFIVAWSFWQSQARTPEAGDE